MNAVVDRSRRDFLKAGALASGALVIGFFVPQASQRALAQNPAAPKPQPVPPPNAFVTVAPDDTVTVLLSHSEMGQGIWTTLPMMIAEELDYDVRRIVVAHAPAAPAYAHTGFGMQMTGGSTSTSSELDRYRKAGALARALLIEAAALREGVAAATIATENGVVIANGKRIRYGELAAEAARRPAPADVKLKDPKDWKVIGRPTRRLDGRAKCDGTAVFGMDVKLDGLLTACVARSPVFGGTVKSYDDGKAKAVAGVRQVVQVPSGVAVLADHYWAAKQGRDALVVEWDLSKTQPITSSAQREAYRKAAQDGGGAVAARAGDAKAAIGKAAARHEAEFVFPYLAHAPMEPLNCTVRIAPDRCEVWTGTQFQTIDQQVAAEITGLKPEQVQIHTTFLGGGFGRRATPSSDFVREAVHVAKASGKPVKVVWSREDDMRGGYYRPAYVHRATIGLDAEGRPTAWDHAIVGQSILAGTPMEPMMVRNGVDATSVEGVNDSPYVKDLADHHVALLTQKGDVPVLWWRSVGHTHTAFVMESLIDELARKAAVDPVTYRRALLARHPRHLGALNLAVAKAGTAAAGRGRGVAVHESFGSYVAQVADVSVEDGRIRVHRVVCAIDCGVVVNPAGVVAQMESGIAFGLGAALHGAITLKDGRVEQSNFHDYRVLRIGEMPEVEVHIVPSREKSGGAGEPGTPPIAPAVANAVAALTGRRLRELPLKLPA